MAEKKVDVVLEVVRYNEQGLVELARGYERRGVEFGDRVLFTRPRLVDMLKGGKTFFTGVRTPYMAGTFKVYQQIRLVVSDGKEFLVAGEKSADQDHLHLPLF